MRQDRLRLAPFNPLARQKIQSPALRAGCRRGRRRTQSLPRNLLVAVVIACAPAPPAADEAAPDGTASATHADLLQLFEDFRVFQEPAIVDGVPDYTAEAMERQRQELEGYKSRIAAFDISGWTVSEQIDHHLVRAEVNGLDFHHRVTRPWSRDPAFYLMSQGGAGPAMSGFRSLFRLEPPFDGGELEEYRTTLQAVPAIYEQARSNLTEALPDLGTIAIWAAPREARIYDEITEQLAEHHPELVADAEAARDAVLAFGAWVEENKPSWSGAAGIGKENYDWWLRNVHLSPYGWEESRMIVEQEYNRLVTFLALEEHRNRDLPPFEIADTPRKYADSLHQALRYVVDFLRDGEVMTVPDWVDPTDYSDPNEPPEPLPSDTSIDHKAREREILPGETHEYIGHMLDDQRRQRDDRPIRGADRRFNMEWMRMEGWAVALEELTMQAGVLDERPRRGREVEYLMNISHMSLALPDLAMHANLIDFDESRALCAALMSKGWSQENERMVWYEMESNLRFPGFHTGVVVGKAHFMKLFRERAMQLGDRFVLRDFIDEFLAGGIIPISLIRWEMTGYDDEIRFLTGEDDVPNRVFDPALQLADRL